MMVSLVAGQYIFACDANQRVGFGHFGRCFNIASGLLAEQPGAEIRFQGDLNEVASARLRAAGMSLTAHYNAGDFAESTLIFDRYDIDQAHINELVRVSRALLMIDDFNQFDFSGAAAVVNFRAGAENWTYNAQRAFLGLKYYPAHPDFAPVRRHKLEAGPRRPLSILVSMGGADRHNAGRLLVRGLDTVVSGARINWLSNNWDDEDPRDLASNELIRTGFSQRMNEHYAAADLVISGGGVTKYEAGFCMIPNACLSQTLEQQQDTEILAGMRLTFDLGLGLNLEIDSGKLAVKLEEFLSETELQAQREQLALHYDAGSLSRLARGILEL